MLAVLRYRGHVCNLCVRPCSPPTHERRVLDPPPSRPFKASSPIVGKIQASKMLEDKHQLHALRSDETRLSPCLDGRLSRAASTVGPEKAGHRTMPSSRCFLRHYHIYCLHSHAIDWEWRSRKVLAAPDVTSWLATCSYRASLSGFQLRVEAQWQYSSVSWTQPMNITFAGDTRFHIVSYGCAVPRDDLLV